MNLNLQQKVSSDIFSLSYLGFPRKRLNSQRASKRRQKNANISMAINFDFRFVSFFLRLLTTRVKKKLMLLLLSFLVQAQWTSQVTHGLSLTVKLFMLHTRNVLIIKLFNLELIKKFFSDPTNERFLEFKCFCHSLCICWKFLMFFRSLLRNSSQAEQQKKRFLRLWKIKLFLVRQPKHHNRIHQSRGLNKFS